MVSFQPMAHRYLLYIDILRFSDLVNGPTVRIDDLYEVIASLNVHNHSGFRAIIFSDTILVYNTAGQNTGSDRRYLVMYLCEFAQDLQHRLTAKDIFFRAVLVRGEFKHYELNNIPCFFGEALIRAHKSEKNIQAIGLFMQNEIVADSNIFPTTRFNDEFSFVFITQTLTRLEADFGGEFPVDAWLFESTGETYLATPEILYLKQLSYFAANHPVVQVRHKYETTLKLFKKQYPKTISFLEKNDFVAKALSPLADWDAPRKQWPQSFGWAIKEREEF